MTLVGTFKNHLRHLGIKKNVGVQTVVKANTDFQRVNICRRISHQIAKKEVVPQYFYLMCFRYSHFHRINDGFPSLSNVAYDPFIKPESVSLWLDSGFAK